MDPNGIQERDLTRHEGAFEEDRAGGGEEGADVGPHGENLGPLEAGDGLGREAEHFPRVLAVADDGEGGLVDGDHASERLDVAAALDPGEVGRDLLLRDRGAVRRRFEGLRVVEGSS